MAETFYVLAEVQSRGRTEKVKEAHNGAKINEANILEATLVKVENANSAAEAGIAVKQLIPGSVNNLMPTAKESSFTEV